MNFALFVAFRYLFARQKQSFIYIISLMSIFGVALGVAALVIVLGVYNGFTTDIRDKILGANSHIIISGAQMSALNKSPIDELMQKVNNVEDVIASTPFIYAEIMLSSPRGVKGIILRGLDVKTAPEVLSLLSKLTSGSVEDLETNGGVIVGHELAKRLGLKVGSRVNLLSPAGQRTATGFTPKIRPAKVVGIFNSGMFEYDSSLGFVSLKTARDILGLPDTYISGFEVAVEDLYDADITAEKLNDALGTGFSARSWKEMNANLFAALELEKIGMFILLAMVVLIGSFSIVTSLVMLVMEKRKDIAILISMGATKRMIKNIFILQGTLIGLIGTILGYILGILVAILLQEYQFIKLPQGVYTIDHLPILLTLKDNIIIGVSAMVLCFFATIYPANQAAKLEPAEALRYE